MGWGRAALFCAVAASLAAGMSSLWMMLSNGRQLRAESLFLGVELIAVFPALVLIASVGYLAATWLWLVPEACRQVAVPRRMASALRLASPAAAVYAAASTAYTLLRVLFPPAALGGRALPPAAALAFDFFGWLFSVLGVAYTWWLWSMVRAVVGRDSRAWTLAAATISWAWPALSAAANLLGIIQDWLRPRAGVPQLPPSLLSHQVLAGLSVALQITSLLLGIASLVLLSALRQGPAGDTKGNTKGNMKE